MKIKLSPVQFIFILYICLSSYLIFSYFGLQQFLSRIDVVNLIPIAYAVLIVGATLLTLSLFSLFRIPFFHYLFKMFHLWIVILFGFILWLYFQYGYMLSDLFNAETQQSIAKTFPVTKPDMFNPLINLIQVVLNHVKAHAINVYMPIAIALVVIQIILYMPSSLRYVYHTHISPIKYTLKHVFLSVLLLSPLLFAANYYVKLDDSLNPRLEALLSIKQVNIKDADNAFFPILALWTPGIADRVAYGKQWLAKDKKMLAYFHKFNKPVKPLEYPAYRELALGGMSKPDRAAINQLYVQRLLAKDPKTEEQLSNFAQKYQAPLQICQSLPQYQHYINPINYTSSSFTGFYNDFAESFLSLQRLDLAELLIQHGSDINDLVKSISGVYSFNLRMIRTSSDSNVKLLFIKNQIVVVQFLYNLLQSPEYQNETLYGFINNMPLLIKTVVGQKPIAQKNILLLKQQLDTAIKSLAGKESPIKQITDYTFKYNKTMNCIFDEATRKYNLDNLDVSAYIKRQKTVLPKAEIDNAIGNIICRASTPVVVSDPYIKAIETNGRIMMLKARSKLFEEKINEVNYDAYLTNHGDKYFNPFTERALKWDSSAKQIYFQYNNGKENVKVSY